MVHLWSSSSLYFCVKVVIQNTLQGLIPTTISNYKEELDPHSGRKVKPEAEFPSNCVSLMPLITVITVKVMMALPS